MKKILTFFIAGAAIAALTTACNTLKDPEQNEGTEIPSVPVNDDVADFFNMHVSQIVRSALDVNSNQTLVDRCIIINSIDDFLEIEGVPALPPPIDFDSHTLILGQWVGGGGLYLVSQSMVVEKAEYKINLTIRQKKEEGVDYNNAIHPVYFWGIYSKINAESITVVVSGRNDKLFFARTICDQCEEQLYDI